MTKTTLCLLPFLSLLLIGFTSCEKRPDADNTARNPAKPNAGDQSETEADREITANIRKAVVADDSLSINAQNVKIITVNGVVTLRGPVKSEKEKMAIEAKAKQVVGVKGVNNLIEIEANQ
jgi:hyperosmotically inducible protein